MDKEAALQFLAAPSRQLSAHYDIAYFALGAAAYGGAERSLLELAKAQRDQGKSVIVCYEHALESTGFLEHARAAGLSLHGVAWAPEAGLHAVLKAAWRLFGSLDARVLHFNISWRRHMWVIPIVARMRTSAMLVGTMRAMPEPHHLTPRKRHFGLVPGLQLWALSDHAMGRAWARTLHRTVSVNREDYPPRLIGEYGFPARKLSVVYNGVPIPERVPDPSERAALKADLGYAADAFLVVYVGRVSSEKGLRYLLAALVNCDPRVKLVIAGDGPELQELKEFVEAQGISSRVRFMGYVSEPMSLFSAADAAVVPSLWNEAFGRVVVEAMACGTPVIATRVGGMGELFEHELQGLYVPKADATALAQALNRLCSDKDLCARLSIAGRELAEQRYATNRVVAQYGEIYASLSGDDTAGRS